MKFKVRKDVYYTVIFWVIILALFATFIYALLFDESISSKIIGCLLTSSIIFISLVFWFNTYYVLTDNNLLVKYGFTNKVIPLHSIQSVSRSNTFLAGPAFASNKIMIVYNNGLNQLFLAPKDETTFINQLVALSDHSIDTNI